MSANALSTYHEPQITGTLGAALIAQHGYHLHNSHAILKLSQPFFVEKLDAEQLGFKKNGYQYTVIKNCFWDHL